MFCVYLKNCPEETAKPTQRNRRGPSQTLETRKEGASKSVRACYESNQKNGNRK